MLRAKLADAQGAKIEMDTSRRLASAEIQLQNWRILRDETYETNLRYHRCHMK